VDAVQPRQGLERRGQVETQSIRSIPTQLAQTVTKKKLTTFVTKRVKGKKKRVKIIRTQVKFSATASANGVPRERCDRDDRDRQKVGGASGSFILAAGRRR
jgi:hypothetical protein